MTKRGTRRLMALLTGACRVGSGGCRGCTSALQLNQSSAGPHAVQWHGHNVASGSIFGGDATLGCLVSKAHSIEQCTWLYFTISALLLCRLS